MVPDLILWNPKGRVGGEADVARPAVTEVASVHTLSGMLQHWKFVLVLLDGLVPCILHCPLHAAPQSRVERTT